MQKTWDQQLTHAENLGASSITDGKETNQQTQSDSSQDTRL
ncbi:hypothetical protein I3843_01G095700 [Carya illinoinensis]|nr:hypothetical protein I3843_01G095700 [Carya illinoinensis]